MQVSLWGRYTTAEDISKAYGAKCFLPHCIFFNPDIK